MAVFNEPTQWDHELGNNADVSTLPDDTSATTGVASLQKLFQIINQTPLEAGGVAPDREDFNALFKILGDSIFYMQNGGVPSYNADYDYIAGRVVLYNGNIYKCIQANGASSTVVAPDSVSPLGSDYWVQVATLADFTNFANTDLSNLSASGQAIIDGKADKDFSNVTAPVQAFKTMVTRWVVPDYSREIAITNYSAFTPDADGVIEVQVTQAVSQNAWIKLGNNNTYDVSKIIWQTASNSAAISDAVQIIVSKNQTYYINLAVSAIGRLVFVPFVGA